jgi:tellurite resistance protein
MTNENKKNQILESLDSLDQAQAENVLEYIKGLLTSSETYHKKLKREAIKEIQQALKNKRKLNLSF